MSFIRNHLWKPRSPFIQIEYEDGQLKAKAFNKAFILEQRARFDTLATGMTDQQVLDLYLGRENLEREEPKLEILHFGIDEAGQLKIKLDWNHAFIRHLKLHGITGETEDEAIENYLARLTRKVDDELNEDVTNLVSRQQVEDAFAEIDKELTSELDEVKKELKKKRQYKRRGNAE